MIEQDRTSGALVGVPRPTPATGRTLFGFTALAGFVALALLKLIGFGAMLLAAGGLLVAAGFSIAAIAWITRSPREDEHVTSWDVAGALVFLGFAAALIAD